MNKTTRYSNIRTTGLFLLGCSVLLAACEPADEDRETLAECPTFAPTYSSCEATGGILPQFFQTVAIEPLGDSYVFLTETDQGPLETHYIPDQVVRLGSDYHTLPDGTLLPDLPSLESSHCEEGTMFRTEVTVLPDGQVAHEEIRLWIGEDGELIFQLDVEGQRLLDARCVE